MSHVWGSHVWGSRDLDRGWPHGVGSSSELTGNAAEDMAQNWPAQRKPGNARSAYVPFSGVRRKPTANSAELMESAAFEGRT